MAKSGFVYCIANDAMPGLVKIGATAREPGGPPRGGAPRYLGALVLSDHCASRRRRRVRNRTCFHALLAPPRRFEARREFFFRLTHEEARAVFCRRRDHRGRQGYPSRLRRPESRPERSLTHPTTRSPTSMPVHSRRGVRTFAAHTKPRRRARPYALLVRCAAHSRASSPTLVARMNISVTSTSTFEIHFSTPPTGEARCAGKHVCHFNDTRDLPASQVGVKERRACEHSTHGFHIAYLPVTKVTVERCRIREHHVHVLNEPYVPETHVAVDHRCT